MDVYYEKLIDLWQAGKIEEVSSYFELWEAEGQFSKEEIEKLKKILPERKPGVWESMKMFKKASPEAQEKIKKLLVTNELKSS
jgi:hypothetical protein